jgi:hypothetical protein
MMMMNVETSVQEKELKVRRKGTNIISHKHKKKRLKCQLGHTGQKNKIQHTGKEKRERKKNPNKCKNLIVHQNGDCLAL